MKLLDKDFRESIIASIDAAGNVVIAGIEFSPLSVLDADKESYRDAFLSWFEDEWLPIRTERLNEILRFAANKGRFDNLVQAVKAGRVVPFIGSGISAPTGMPTWTKFLRELRQSSTLPEAELEKLIAAGQYEEAASALLAAMPNHLFDERMEETFVARAAGDVTGAVRFLPDIFTETIITTNFDNVLEVIHEDAGKPFLEKLNGAAISQFRVLRGKGRRCLMKIHGHHTDPASRVLTKDEYDKAYGAGCPARVELQFVFGSEPLLFLGCGLAEDRTMHLIKEVVDHDKGTPRNYALLPCPKTEPERLAREHFLTARKIFPIWYQGGHDDSVEAVLVGLLRATGKI
jgi:hypothetical protein